MYIVIRKRKTRQTRVKNTSLGFWRAPIPETGTLTYIHTYIHKKNTLVYVTRLRECFISF